MYNKKCQQRQRERYLFTKLDNSHDKIMVYILIVHFRKKHYVGQIVLTNHPFNNSGILYKVLCHT